MTRKDFDVDYIERELRVVHERLASRIVVHMIGGGAMAYWEAKAGTRDVDVMLATREDADALADALEAIGYARPGELDDSYVRMNARSFLENEDGFRWDIFVQDVLGYRFSDDMAKRAEKWLELSRLTVTIISREDIFLFKALTDRERDRDDMNVLIAGGLDVDAIHDEVRRQAARGGPKSVAAAFVHGVDELVEKYGIDYAIPDDIVDLAATDMIADALPTTLRKKGSATISELAKQYAQSPDIVERAARRLVDQGIVQLKGERLELVAK